MHDPTTDLRPYPLAHLLGRVEREFAARGAVFDLPAGKWFRRPDDVDLSCDVMGHRVGTPVGPAAGPHTQLAQNIALSWLAGARTIELKTVQVLDELEIPRPCIDMATVGYNVEWSQELRLEESLREYAKARLLLEVLKRWEPVRSVVGDPGADLFELSCGYDLAGVRSDAMAVFLDGIQDAGAQVDALRDEIPAAFAALRDVPVEPRLAASVTLSTFHGCPPEEIEAIVRHLMDRHGFDVTVKLNPTLLGLDTVEELLHGRLGYDHVPLDPEAFAADLQFARGLELIDALDAHARAAGRRFGIKLTNTLVVENHTGRLPGDRMYLSGRPLHVLAATLLARLDAALPLRLALGGRDGIPVSFSAGIEKANAAAACGLGLAPVTVCSDLLKPGGYGRLNALLKGLGSTLRDAGCADLGAWVRHVAARAGEDGPAAAYAASLTTAAGAAPYRADAVEKPPRRNDATLALWDCSSCHLCVTVCPNNAMIRLATPPELSGRLEKKWQYLCLADACNDCGNCETFCPDNGPPQRRKPRLTLAADDPSAGTVRGGPGAFMVRGGPAPEDVAAVLNGPDGLPWPEVR